MHVALEMQFWFGILYDCCRSDLESVLIAIFKDILCVEGSEDGSSSHQDIVNIFLSAANFSIPDEKCTEEAMSFEDFRSWCAHIPTVRKLLGCLLFPPDSGLAALYMHYFWCWLNFLLVYLKHQIWLNIKVRELWLCGRRKLRISLKTVNICVLLFLHGILPTLG
jgi:hypothetical protein